MTQQTPALLNYEALSMTSREVATLTGKRPDNVVRDLANMVAELRGDGQRFVEPPDGEVVDDSLGATQAPQAYLTQVCAAPSPTRGLQVRGYVDTLGRAGQSEFVLDLEILFLLLTGYSLQARQAVIKQWQAAEAKLAQLSADTDLLLRLPPPETQAVWDAGLRVAQTQVNSLMNSKGKKAMIAAVENAVGLNATPAQVVAASLEFYNKNAAKFLKMAQPDARESVRQLKWGL